MYMDWRIGTDEEEIQVMHSDGLISYGLRGALLDIISDPDVVEVVSCMTGEVFFHV